MINFFLVRKIFIWNSSLHDGVGDDGGDCAKQWKQWEGDDIHMFEHGDRVYYYYYDYQYWCCDACRQWMPVVR